MEVIHSDGSWKNPETKKSNNNLYEIITKLPAPIKKFNLSTDQKFWYKYYGDQLVASNRLTKTDMFHLHRLARSIDYYLQAEEKIAEKGYTGGLIQVFPSGATNISGHVSIREKMLKDIDEISKHFGFSFKDRAKLTQIKEDPNQLDIFDQFLQQNA